MLKFLEYQQGMPLMSNVTRRNFVVVGMAAAGAAATGMEAGGAQAQSGFTAASSNKSEFSSNTGAGPGIQGIAALCEVTGGGAKVYGIAIAYDSHIDPASIGLATYSAGVVPAPEGYFPGMPEGLARNATTQAAEPRAVSVIYTNTQPALRADRKSVAGSYVIAEFAHDTDLSLPTSDSDKVMLSQVKPVRTTGGATYAASDKVWNNAGRRGNTVFIRGVDDWEQHHWWWDDSRSAWLEYSIYLPKSFLEPGGEKKA